jgi:uncharacterized membrane protein
VDPKRIARHLLATPLALRRAFPPASLAAIQRALADSEARHGGEIRFAVEGALDLRALLAGQPARERAIEVFGELRVWDTEQNNGVLIYLLLADHDVEIVADRGVSARVAGGEWQRICAAMERDFTRGRFADGVIHGIEAVAALLAAHFPAADRNELPDKPVVL